MDVVTYSEARANLKDVMDRVVADKTEIIVTRQKAEAVCGDGRLFPNGIRGVRRIFFRRP